MEKLPLGFTKITLILGSIVLIIGFVLEETNVGIVLLGIFILFLANVNWQRNSENKRHAEHLKKTMEDRTCYSCSRKDGDKPEIQLVLKRQENAYEYWVCQDCPEKEPAYYDGL